MIAYLVHASAVCGCFHRPEPGGGSRPGGRCLEAM